MKKPKKRYDSAKQIEAQIDKVKAKQAANAAECERLDAIAKSLFMWVSQRDGDLLYGEALEDYRAQYHKAVRARNEADTLRKYHGGFENKLLHLKKTLAAFNTDTLSFESDKSVVLQ